MKWSADSTWREKKGVRKSLPFFNTRLSSYFTFQNCPLYSASKTKSPRYGLLFSTFHLNVFTLFLRLKQLWMYSISWFYLLFLKNDPILRQLKQFVKGIYVFVNAPRTLLFFFKFFCFLVLFKKKKFLCSSGRFLLGCFNAEDKCRTVGS